MHRTIDERVGQIGDSPGLLVGVVCLAGVVHVALDCLCGPADPAAVPPQLAHELPGSGQPELVALFLERLDRRHRLGHECIQVGALGFGVHAPVEEHSACL